MKSQLRGHEFPKPLWNATDETLILPADVGEKYEKKTYEPGEILYVANRQDLDKVSDMKVGHQSAWSEKYIKSTFPRAMHGPNGQSVTVYNMDEQKRALKNGWSLKPIVSEERPVDAPPSPDAPPRGLDLAIA